MKGRSSEQLKAYENKLDAMVEILKRSPMSVREIRNALSVKRRKKTIRPAAATVYARLEVLVERGNVISSKRRKKIAGKSGQRERVYSVRA